MSCRRLLPVALIGVLFCWSIAAPAAASQRIALIIGNGAYVSTGALRNPANDAALMATTLRQVGFTVFEHTDLDQKDMKRAIIDFGDRLLAAGEDAVGLFYYSGHGLQAQGYNYLLPVDATIRHEKDIEIESVKADAVLQAMAAARNALNIVILDACRNNPFATGYRSATQGLAQMDAPRGTLIAYSTAPGTVALDGEGRNSPYTHALSRAIRQPGMKVEDVFKVVRIRVMEQTGEVQVPWESSSLTGDFVFLGGAGPEAPAQLAALAPLDDKAFSQAVSDETVFWHSIEASRNPDDFEAYLDRFGDDGIFSRLARNRVLELRKPGVAVEVQTRSAMTDDQAARAAIAKAQEMLEEMRTSAGMLMGRQDQSMARRLEKFRGLLGFVVDFEVMARFVAGKYRDEMTQEEWDKYFHLYRELFLSVYDFTSGDTWGQGIEVTEIRPYGGDYLVRLALGPPGPDRKEVGLRVRRKDQSYFGFMIIDALVSGVSVLKTQHDDFQSVLRRGGVSGLLARLEEIAGPVVEAPLEIPN